MLKEQVGGEVNYGIPRNGKAQTLSEMVNSTVNLFDQVNSDNAINRLGSRGKHLVNAIADLRNALNLPDKEVLEKEAIWVVDLFDQANTAGAIERLGEKGKEIAGRIDNLRGTLNQGGTKTTLTQEVINSVREDRYQNYLDSKHFAETGQLRTR